MFLCVHLEPELCSHYTDWPTGRTIRGSNSVRGKIFFSSEKHQNWLRGPYSPAEWYRGLFPGRKEAGA
jgi:hypothetical protein